MIEAFLLKSALAYRLSLMRYRINGYLHSLNAGDNIVSNRKKRLNAAPYWVNNPLDPSLPGYRYQADDWTCPERLEQLALLEALILEMNAVSEKNNAKFIVFSESSDAGRRKWELEWNGIQTDGQSDFVLWGGKKYIIDIQRPLKELEKITKRNGIPLIKPQRVYERYRFNRHTNKVGNARMAEDIIDFLLNFTELQKWQDNKE